MRARYRLSGFCLLAIGLTALVGCSGGEPATPEGAATVQVVERDFRISAPDRLDAGPVSLSVKNRGPDAHEFLLVRSSRSELPLRDDGITVDEDAIEPDTVEALEPEPPGVRELQLDLEPGRYVLLCNMTGHYMGGMYADLVVE